MKPILALLRAQPRARRFFAAVGQSALGTGAAYIAVVVLAYERLHSPLGITAVLLAQFLPAMMLGPIVGAAADRWPRKLLLVGADVLRAGAFAGLALAGGFAGTVAFAALAGLGNAIFNPTVIPALPSLVSHERSAAATSLYGGLNELGNAAGPGLAAIVLLVTGPAWLLLGNAATFGVSAVILATLRFDGAGPAAHGGRHRQGLLRSAWEGMRTTAADAGIRAVLLTSSAAVVCLGAVNIGELLLAKGALGASDAQFAVLVGTMGVGIAAGSLLASAGGSVGLLKSRYLGGLLLCAGGLVGAGLAPAYTLAIPFFALMGVGNGIALSYERLLLQAVVPDAIMGRVFGIKNSLVSWAFGISFVAGGGFAALVGPRALFVAAGVAIAAAWAAATFALRRHWEPAPSHTLRGWPKRPSSTPADATSA
jgi:MFS family permease